MVRLVNVFLLGCLVIVVGAAFVVLASWALAAAGFGGVATGVVAIGLAIILPCSFILAGSILPGPPRPPANLLVCPHCDAAFPVWFRHERPEGLQADAH